MYIAWEHGAAFDDTDMQRLARTFTHGFQPDAAGSFSWDLGKPGKANLSQSARWTFLARFDPTIEQRYLEFVASRDAINISSATPTLAAIAYTYLLHARNLRRQDQTEQ